MKPFWMARLAGTQEQMGAQHGRLAADDAVRLFDFYRSLPVRALAGDTGPVAKAVVRAVSTTWQRRLARERPPELVARTRAFVDAVKAARADAGSAKSGEVAPRVTERSTASWMLSIACMDALQNCVSLVGRAKLGPFANPVGARARAAAIPACSTVVAWGDATADGELLFARNFDFPGVGVWDAAPAFIVCAPDGGQRYGFFTTRGADAPVVTVVNEAGIVLAPHTRWHKGVGFGGAMIVDLVHSIARRAETLADVEAIARERPISSSWGICVGSAREKSALTLEIAGPQLEVLHARGNYMVCTNHYRSEALRAGQLAGSHAWGLHSGRRERRLRALVEGRSAPLDAPTLARFLGDREDAGMMRHLGSVLAQPTNVHAAVVSPAHRRALVGIDAAPTCEGAWADFAWEWDGPAGAWELGATEASGFAAAARTDVVAPHDEATRHVHTAVAAYEGDHDVAAASAAIERAIACAPDDPSLRLAATWIALDTGAAARAVAHARAGLRHERDDYRRGQLLLWGARAARVHGDDRLAHQWNDELAHLPGDGIDELRAASTKKWRGRPHANLMMTDAY